MCMGIDLVFVRVWTCRMGITCVSVQEQHIVERPELFVQGDSVRPGVRERERERERESPSGGKILSLSVNV